MKKLDLYLDDSLRESVARKDHNFFNKLISAFEGRGFEIRLRPNSGQERLKSVRRSGYSLFHLEEPFHNKALDIRLAYMYPFWRIERAKWREDYSVARKTFDPDEVDAAEAARFFGFWQRKMQNAGWQPPVQKGYVYIPLQGRLLDKRHGQTMTPIDMIRATLAHEHNRDLVVKLHPKENYTKPELDAVAQISQSDRVTISTSDSNSLTSGCDYVVTQNSSVAFKGILHKKPAILFGRSDFHHIFQDVGTQGLKESFNSALIGSPAYEKYFYWFLQLNCINAGKDGAGDRILDICRGHGWDV